MPRPAFRRLQSLPDIPLQWMALNRRHPLAAGLAFYVICQGGVALDLVTSARGTANGTLAEATTRDGRAADIDGSDYFDLGNNAQWNVNPGSLIWRGIVDTGSTVHQFCSKHLNNGVSDNPFTFLTTNDAAPLLELVRANNSGVYEIHNGPATTVGALKTYGVTFPSAIENLPTFYADGVATIGVYFFGSGAGGSGPNTQPLLIGRRADGVAQLDGKVNLCAGWSRVLSDAEMMRIHLDPYAVIADRRQSKAYKSIVVAAVPGRVLPVVVNQAVHRAANW